MFLLSWRMFLTLILGCWPTLLKGRFSSSALPTFFIVHAKPNNLLTVLELFARNLAKRRSVLKSLFDSLYLSQLQFPWLQSACSLWVALFLEPHLAWYPQKERAKWEANVPGVLKVTESVQELSPKSLPKVFKNSHFSSYSYPSYPF